MNRRAMIASLFIAPIAPRIARLISPTLVGRYTEFVSRTFTYRGAGISSAMSIQKQYIEYVNKVIQSIEYYK